MIRFLKKSGRRHLKSNISLGTSAFAGPSIIERKKKRRSERGVAVLLLIVFLLSCSGMPRLKPADPKTLPDIAKQCLRPFPGSPYRLIHSVEASFSGGTQIHLLGVLLVDPEARSIHSIIMTIEGFVLFDAEFGKLVQINRGVPPFDSVAYAEHMMEDLWFMIFPPPGILSDAGFADDGSTVCRFRDTDGATTDISVVRESAWFIRRYDRQDILTRTVRASHLNENNIPGRLDLESFGSDGYALHMALISAEPVTSETNKP